MIKNFFIIFSAILIATGIYYRDYIPTTRSDVENLYYFFTGSDIQSDPEPLVGSELNSKPTDSNGSKLNLEPTTRDPSATAEPGSAEFTPSNNGGRYDNLNENNTNDKTVLEQKNSAIPASFNNAVPFTPQAPFGKWDQLHEEACEEASLAMAHYFIEKRELVLSKEADKDIIDLAKYINKDDVTITEIKGVAENYYKHFGWKITENPSVEEIKKILASGKTIIAPMAGRELGNPNFKQPGPLYHMLVISGYDNKKGVFITQDPGTRKGKNYEYKFNILMNALHDFPGDKNKIKDGDKKILIAS